MMRAVAVTALLCVLLGAHTRAEWVEAVKDLARKVPRVEISTVGEDGAVRSGTCSGAFINTDAGYVVSAAHCYQGDDVDITVDGRDASVLRLNRVLDLAVLHVKPKNSDRAFEVATTTPPPGTLIAVIGYAFGSKQPVPTFGHMSLPRDDSGQYSLLNLDTIVGDSGGPIIDGLGRLVGIQSAIQYAGPMHLGLSVPVETVRDYVSSYLPAPKP